MLDDLLDGVVDRHAVHLAPFAAGGDPADDLRAGAVVEALSREVDRLAAGDPLDDEREVLVEENTHPATSSALRPGASGFAP